MNEPQPPQYFNYSGCLQKDAECENTAERRRFAKPRAERISNPRWLWVYILICTRPGENFSSAPNGRELFSPNKQTN
jgi:hypothetical protein